MGLISTIVGGIVDANKLIKQKDAQKNNTIEHVVVNNQYAIDVPSFLSPMKNLSEDASLQYGNKALDISFMVIDESKYEFIQSLHELADFLPKEGGETLLDKMALITLDNMFDMDNVEIDEYKTTTINGLNAVTLNVFQKRTFFKDAVYGSFAFIEGATTLYQIIILSGGTSIAKLAEKLEPCIRSFREL